MGNLAEKIIAELGIRREVLDEWTKKSYERARAAQSNRVLDWEIVDIIKDRGRGNLKINKDEEWLRYFPDSIPALFPIYSKNGALTAASSAKLNDGASAIVLMEEEYAKALGIRPLARIIGYHDSAVAPVDYTIANYRVTEELLEKTGTDINDIDFHEIHENYASVPIANMKLLDLDLDKVNVNGGSIALGHPLGMSGNRLIVSLINILRQNNGSLGLASVCHGGGGASAMLIERMN